MGEDTWNALFNGRRFITDLGHSEEAEVEVFSPPSTGMPSGSPRERDTRSWR